MFSSSVTEAYVQFINQYFRDDTHFFIIKPAQLPLSPAIAKEHNVLTLDYGVTEPIAEYTKKSDKIYIHGMFHADYVRFLCNAKELLPKTNWVIYGGDLYCLYESDPLYETKMFLIKSFGQVSTLADGDYSVAVDKFSATGTHLRAMYTNPLSIDVLKSAPMDKMQSINIQIGHTATKTLQHKEYMDLVQSFVARNAKDYKVQIYTPLTYGDMNYREEVIEYGHKLFKDAYFPLTESVQPRDYAAFLNSMDIALFPQQRQQGICTIEALFYLGKKVYIRSDSTIWNHFKQYDIQPADIIKLPDESFDDFLHNSFEDENRRAAEALMDIDFRRSIWEKNFLA